MSDEVLSQQHDANTTAAVLEIQAVPAILPISPEPEHSADVWSQQHAPATGEQWQPKAAALEDVLAYQHNDVVYRFVKTYGVSQSEAQDIFEQVKKWLWLANYRRRNGIHEGLNIDHPLVVIDEMWHNFVLFTKEYTAFCLHFFGYYVHHAPATEAEELEYRAKLKGLGRAEVHALKTEMKRAQYEYIYDHLGKDTFVKWYVEYPRKYSFRQLAEMHLKALDNMVLIELKAPVQATVPGNNT